MCQQNNNIKSRKGKHLEYSERQSIERWFNRDKRTKVEIATLLDRTEKTIRNEIKRGLVKNLTTLLEEIWVYSADVAQQRYEYYLRAKGPKLKIDNDYELKEYVEKSIKKDKKSPEVIAEEIKEMNFKTRMCARTIRNNIASGDIYEIKPKDMIYNKKYKDKNKDKKICESIPPEKSIDYRPEEANTREEYGHWEGDLVIGKKKKGAVLLTFTERKTREEIIVKIASKEADEDHNLGHGKAEYIFSLFISLSMIGISLKLLYDSLISLIYGFKFEFSWFLVIVCIATIIVKLCLYFYTKIFQIIKL